MLGGAAFVHLDVRHPAPDIARVRLGLRTPVH